MQQQHRERSDALTLSHGLGPQQVRRINREIVLRCIRDEGPLARVHIAERTGLSRSAVSVIVEELLRTGVICEGDMLPATARGGRRAVLLYLASA